MAHNEDFLFTAGNDGIIRVFELGEYGHVGTLKGHAEAIMSLVISAGRLFSSDYDGAVMVWDARSLQKILTLTPTLTLTLIGMQGHCRR